MSACAAPLQAGIRRVCESSSPTTWNVPDDDVARILSCARGLNVTVGVGAGVAGFAVAAVLDPAAPRDTSALVRLRYPLRARTVTPFRLTRTLIDRNCPSSFVLVALYPIK